MCIKNVRPPSVSDIDRNRIKSKIHINSIFFLFRIHFYKFILILDIFIRMYYVIHISLIRVFFKLLFMTVSGGRGNGASRSARNGGPASSRSRLNPSRTRTAKFMGAPWKASEVNVSRNLAEASAVGAYSGLKEACGRDKQRLLGGRSGSRALANRAGRGRCRHCRRASRARLHARGPVGAPWTRKSRNPRR